MAKAEKGYEIALDKARNILKMRLWGLWDASLIQQFEQEVQKKILEMSQHAPQGWFTLVDVSQFPPQLADTQTMTREVMNFEVVHGMKKAATLMAQTMTKMQIQRLAKEEGFDPGSFFQSEAEAIGWLLSK
jgi:hypothetical protein